MKFAIFGDIHANLEALQAVLDDAANQSCTHFVCIGDIVGYNANPHECLRIVRDLECPVVKGNHDEEASSGSPLTGLNPLAAQAMDWTREHLDDDDKQWLRDLRMVRQVRDFTIVHATLDTPSSWGYITNKFDAMASFSYQYTPVCFFGHTHSPKFYAKAGSVTVHQGNVLDLEVGNKYFINVGSVGQPRDGDWRASYAVYDMAAPRVTIRRIDYDLETAQKKVVAGGLPSMLADRLALGK